MPPRVTYWTGTWDPLKEAISKEIAALRVGFRRAAPLVGFSPAHASEIDLVGRSLRLSHHRWITLRAAAAAIERLGDITHVFGGRSSWHLLRAVGRRPIVLTSVLPDDPGIVPPHLDFARVVVEADEERAEWLRLGLSPGQIEVVRPGIDLAWYRPMPRAAWSERRFLFASTPAESREFAARGIVLLIELARLRPDIEILVPWRQWGDLEEAKRALGELDPPPNFVIRHRDVSDMRAVFTNVSATIVAFDRGVGKALPNFVVEGLAMGRPCVTTEESGLAPIIASSCAGVVAARSVEALSDAVDRVLGEWPALSKKSRLLAEAEFDLAAFRARYERIYADVAGAPRA